MQRRQLFGLAGAAGLGLATTSWSAADAGANAVPSRTALSRRQLRPVFDNTKLTLKTQGDAAVEYVN